MRIYWVIIVWLTSINRVVSQEITYNTVAPIFAAKCASCHRPGEAAPFSLLTYEDIAKRTSFIKTVITDNYMPPWKADIHYQDYGNNRSLTPKEKQLLLQWIAAKAPRGKPVPENTQQLTLLQKTAYNRLPDTILQIEKPLRIPGDNTERFVTFKIPFERGQEVAIEAIEFYCNNKKIIHHVNYGIYEVADTAINITGGSPYVNVIDEGVAGEAGYKPLKSNMIYYTGWIPGASVESYAPNIGWTLPRRGVLLITAHYAAIAAEETSTVGVNLFFRKTPVQRTIKIISLGSGGIGERDIFPPFIIRPDRVSDYHLAVKTTEEQSLIYVWPHMHFIGKEFLAYAITPSRDTIPLVHIPQWDFRWQEMYRFKKPVHIPKGAVIHLHCVYDNTAANPFNPNSPPRAVYSYGDMTATNEMMTLLMMYLPYQAGDEKMVWK
ncbi:monooxygenase [Filimonas lacunae]|nr:cytochrome c [Filimonas lacunae]